MKKHIVFDLFGVIFNISKLRALNYIGWIPTIKYIVTNQKNPTKEFFILLDKMRLEEPGEFQDTVTYEGIYLPVIFCQWFKGYKTTKQTISKILVFIEKLDKENYFKNNNNKLLFEKLFHIMADSTVISKIIYKSSRMKKLIQTLNKKGHSCYVLSNIDTQTYELIQKLFPDIFNLFKGQIASCDVHYIKPQKEIYLKLHEKFGINLENCLYIDDQQENIIAANSLGMKGILMNGERGIIRKIFKNLN